MKRMNYTHVEPKGSGERKHVSHQQLTWYIKLVLWSGKGLPGFSESNKLWVNVPEDELTKRCTDLNHTLPLEIILTKGIPKRGSISEGTKKTGSFPLHPGANTTRLYQYELCSLAVQVIYTKAANSFLLPPSGGWPNKVQVL